MPDYGRPLRFGAFPTPEAGALDEVSGSPGLRTLTCASTKRPVLPRIVKARNK